MVKTPSKTTCTALSLGTSPSPTSSSLGAWQLKIRACNSSNIFAVQSPSLSKANDSAQPQKTLRPRWSTRQTLKRDSYPQKTPTKTCSSTGGQQHCQDEAQVARKSGDPAFRAAKHKQFWLRQDGPPQILSPGCKMRWQQATGPDDYAIRMLTCQHQHERRNSVLCILSLHISRDSVLQDVLRRAQDICLLHHLQRLQLQVHKNRRRHVNVSPLDRSNLLREKPKVPLVPFPLKARTLTSHTSADSSLFFTVRAT